jgi:CsoR family transcriptional regulator, copper-sensing transcriptional repressor
LLVSTSSSDTERTDRADRVAERLAVPVLIAALASVPAVFLTLFDDPWSDIGSGINMVSGAVLVLETVVLLTLAEDRRAWLRRNWWLVALAIVIVPAVLLAVAPVQLLRLTQLVRFAGALRIIRVGRIFKAGRIVRERTGLDDGWQRAIGIGATVLCAAFVAIVLADPTSASREALDRVVGTVGIPGVVLAGGLLAVATYLVRTDRVNPSRRGAEDDQGGESPG